MTKKVINQNTKLNQELINTIEPKFIFADKPINRFNILETKNGTQQTNKEELIKNSKFFFRCKFPLGFIFNKFRSLIDKPPIQSSKTEKDC